MPLNVAMEQIDTWVISLESDDSVTFGVNKDGVTAHWNLWCHVQTREVLRVSGTIHHLEIVPVEMERVVGTVVVVDCDFDSRSIWDNIRVGISAIDEWILHHT